MISCFSSFIIFMQIKKRAREGGRAIGRPNGKDVRRDSGLGDDFSSGGSDDDSYGSHGRQSDHGG